MVGVDTDNRTGVWSEDILVASIPSGFAIIDTGCTTSVIGRECANRLIDHLRRHQLPLPEKKTLPPVELKGFSGEATTTTEGLVWHVQLETIWGTITTYVIPGKTAFLLSKGVLEGMEAQLNLGTKNADFCKTWNYGDGVTFGNQWSPAVAFVANCQLTGIQRKYTLRTVILVIVDLRWSMTT